jgi:hypothetical protein
MTETESGSYSRPLPHLYSSHLMHLQDLMALHLCRIFTPTAFPHLPPQYYLTSAQKSHNRISDCTLAHVQCTLSAHTG